MAETLDALLAVLARTQGGHITRKQLLAGGLTAAAVEWRIKRGHLIPVYAGVYAVGHLPCLPLDRAHAALLACGSGAILARGSAASLWGYFPSWRFPFEVTTPDDRRPRSIRVYRCRSLAPQDITTQLGIRTTSRARTILDIAPRLTDRRLTRLVNDARHDRHLRLDELDELLRRLPRAPSAARLRRITGIAAVTPTRSDLEDDFRAFCETYDFPQPQTNVIVGGVEVDAFFADAGVIVELDGYRSHTTRNVFEGDRRRDAKHLRQGFPTVRVTSERMALEPDDQAADLHAILARAHARRTA